MRQEKGNPEELSRGREFETPLTFKAEQDGPGMACKTLKHYRQTKQLDEAKLYGEKWLKIHGPSKQVLVTLATVYLASVRQNDDPVEDLARAESLTREALSAAPRDPAARNLLAEALIKQGRKDEAIQLLEEALQGSPNDKVAKQMLEYLKNPPRP